MANGPTAKNETIIRWLLAALSVSLAAWVSISIFGAFGSTSDEVKLVNYDDLAVKAIDFVQHGAERFFQMGVLVLGGIWTLAIVDRDQRVKLADTPELVMFVIATSLFLIELYFLQRYDQIVERVVWDVRTLPGEQGQRLFPDILRSPYIELHYRVIVKCFYSGLTVSGFTVLSLCRLR
jgi:hypothetical protein